MNNVKSTKKYKSQAARDAQQCNYGDSHYWQYLDDASIKHSEYFKKIGDYKRAEEMLTESLGSALKGNDGE